MCLGRARLCSCVVRGSCVPGCTQGCLWVLAVPGGCSAVLTSVCGGSCAPPVFRCQWFQGGSRPAHPASLRDLISRAGRRKQLPWKPCFGSRGNQLGFTHGRFGQAGSGPGSGAGAGAAVTSLGACRGWGRWPGAGVAACCPAHPCRLWLGSGTLLGVGAAL